MANVIEEAKSGRASCRTCRKPIAKGELRLGVETQTQLKAARAEYPGDVPNRAEIDAAMEQAEKKAAAKPAGHPYADHAPTGRARCMQCEQAIEKGAFRVAVERELE